MKQGSGMGQAQNDALAQTYGNTYIRTPIYSGGSSVTPPALFKCLSDETRVRAVLLVIQESELCVCELVCALNDSQPKVSRHLAQLRACGLLVDRRKGQWVYYSLNPDLPSWIHKILQTTLQAHTEWLKQDQARLDQMGDRPVRVASCC